MVPGVWRPLSAGAAIKIVDVVLTVDFCDPDTPSQQPTSPEESGQLARHLVEQLNAIKTHSASAYLEVLGGRDVGLRRDLLEPVLLVVGGDGPEGSWGLSDPELRGVTFSVRTGEGRFWIQGPEMVHVNNESLTDQGLLLRSGDRIALGDTILLFYDALERHFPVDGAGELAADTPLEIPAHEAGLEPEVIPRPDEPSGSVWGAVELGLLVAALVLFAAAVTLAVLIFG